MSLIPPDPFVKKSVGTPRVLTFDEMIEQSWHKLLTIHNGIIPGHESKRPKKLVGYPLDVQRPISRSRRSGG